MKLLDFSIGYFERPASLLYVVCPQTVNDEDMGYSHIAHHIIYEVVLPQNFSWDEPVTHAHIVGGMRHCGCGPRSGPHNVRVAF